MNHRLSALAGLALLLLAGHVMAGTPGPARAKAGGSQPGPDAKSAEVTKLKQEVAAQEDKGRQADKRLQQQDQTIADLQRQLKEVRAAPASQAKHP